MQWQRPDVQLTGIPLGCSLAFRQRLPGLATWPVMGQIWQAASRSQAFLSPAGTLANGPQLIKMGSMRLCVHRACLATAGHALGDERHLVFQ